MQDSRCVAFLQWALPHLQLRWRGFRKVRRQVCRRVARRWKELGLDSFDAYRFYLQEHPEEWATLDEFCRITISRFYRDRSVFDFLCGTVLPVLAGAARQRGDDVLRMWSAGCASGEEPYTLAVGYQIELEPQFPDLGLLITATDADPLMLERARRGCYSASSLKDLPPSWLAAAFVPEGDHWCVRDEFRRGIEFLRQDIRREQPAGPFSLILCRHLVFTYFDESLQMQILPLLLERLHTEGALVTGKQEPLPVAAADLLQEWAPHTGVYRRR